jgi:hypothetical protein
MELRSVLEAEPGPVAPPARVEIPSTRVWWRRPDHLVAVVATIVIIFLHVCLTPNVGGLWRDEVNTLNLATLPTWHDVWEFHNQDSFPLLFAGSVRIWSRFFGSGDDTMRVLGLIIGLGVVAALWINARLMGLPFPFWSLLLVGANPMIIRYGDSTRGYGLSLIFLPLMFGSIWNLTQKRGWRSFGMATLVAVVGVHATYYNAVLLFAICAGGCFVALKERHWRTSLAVFSVGVAAAISLLPYAQTFLRANDWNYLVQYPFTLPWMWERLSEVTGSPLSFGVAIWSGLFCAAVIVGALAIFRGGKDLAAQERRRIASFCVVALLVGIVCYAGFLKLLNYHTQPWYYLSLITFVAICIDPILWPKKGGLHLVLRAGAAALFLASTAYPASRVIAPRHTNLDIVAHKLETLAAPEDLIVLTRWECGVTFQRYYRGRAPWITIPPLADFRFQALQPIIAQMRTKSPLRSIIAQATTTLKSGHRIWLIGETPAPPPGEPPPFLPPVGDGKDGWRGSVAFYTVWMEQVMYFLQQHITHKGAVIFPDAGPVIWYEDLNVHVVEGWE